MDRPSPLAAVLEHCLSFGRELVTNAESVFPLLKSNLRKPHYRFVMCLFSNSMPKQNVKHISYLLNVSKEKVQFYQGYVIVYAFVLFF